MGDRTVMAERGSTGVTGVPSWRGEALPCDEALPPATRVRVETDRHSAEAVPADKLVQALTLKRANGSTYVSNVAQTALSMALENDPSLIDVLATKTYIP